RLLSSTNVSGQTSEISSCLLINSPALCTSMASISKARFPRRTGVSPRNNICRSRISTKGPKEKHWTAMERSPRITEVSRDSLGPCSQPSRSHKSQVRPRQGSPTREEVVSGRLPPPDGRPEVDESRGLFYWTEL